MPFHFNYEQKYPYTQFEKINLDWILELATQLKEAAENGDFDGPPGPPGSGTATNGIAWFYNINTLTEIETAINEGMYPVLIAYVNGEPVFMPCYLHSAGTLARFIGFNNGMFYQWTIDSTNAWNVTQTTYAPTVSPNFTGNPTAPTPAATDSSTRIANTQFVQNAVSIAVQSAIEQLVIAPFSESFKQALLQIARKVAYIDSNGQTYYQALYDALYPPINVDYITAAWTPPVGYVVYSTDTLDSLKNELTVTAYYDNGTSAVLNNSDYTLAGTLTAGTSVITVSYAGALTTVSIPVVENAIDHITAIFNQSGTIYSFSSLDNLVPYLTVTKTYTNLNTVYVDWPDYTLSGNLYEGNNVITVSYQGHTDTFVASATVKGYIYHFSQNIVSSGSKDFGFSGPENFGTGFDGSGYSYCHLIDNGVDQGSIKNLNLQNKPDLSGDFTISGWCKADNPSNFNALILCGYKYNDNAPTTNVTNSVSTVSNLAAGWTANTSGALSRRYYGLRFHTVTGNLAIHLWETGGNSRGSVILTPPVDFVLDTWHHYALTRKNGVLRVFVDGALICNFTYNKSLYMADQVTTCAVFRANAEDPTGLIEYNVDSWVDDLYVTDWCKWDATWNL